MQFHRFGAGWLALVFGSLMQFYGKFKLQCCALTLSATRTVLCATHSHKLCCAFYIFIAQRSFTVSRFSLDTGAQIRGVTRLKVGHRLTDISVLIYM